MRVLRIILQFIIVCAGGITIAALISNPSPDIVAIVVIIGFFGFLLALTFALKEQTQARSIPEHRLNYKPMGIAIFLLGAFGLFYGVSLLLGTATLPDECSGHRRAICELILIGTQAFGKTTARLLAFVLWSAVGSWLCFLGYKIILGKSL